MTFEEKNLWAYGVASLVVPVAYFGWLVAQAQDTPAAEIGYLPALLWAIGLGIALNILGGIVAGLSNPAEVGKKDQRDRDVTRRGDAISFYVFSIAAAGPLVLAMADADTFWIANTLYAAYALTAVVGVAVKIVSYRKGL
ncbi:MAG: hypothetical protein JW722_07225 [Demequinaceae bacterium]|nr:hypothetical protein [Demequinaceae bacterium]